MTKLFLSNPSVTDVIKPLELGTSGCCHEELTLMHSVCRMSCAADRRIGTKTVRLVGKLTNKEENLYVP